MASSDVSAATTGPNYIKLVSITASTISHVSLYTGRAEIKRVYPVSLKAGHNHVDIHGLPNVLDEQSLRVDGKGSAIIQNVTISYIPDPEPGTSPTLKDLEYQLARNRTAYIRSKKSLASLEKFLDTLDAEHVESGKLGTIVEDYEGTAAKLDDKLSALERDCRDLQDAIAEEKFRLTDKSHNDKLKTKVAVNVFAEEDTDASIILIYNVTRANWTAAYDIRVDMQNKDAPVKMIYKAAIAQKTGESWNNVPLTLETATPTFDTALPGIVPWKLSVRQPTPPGSGRGRGGKGLGKGGAFRHRKILAEDDDIDEEVDDEMLHSGAELTSKGNMNATFRIPGLATIPSDGAAHHFTIVELQLEALLTWVSIPKFDTKTHLEARIKNASDYTLIAGTSSVYVDGSFISRSDIPPVSPQESFDCPLGLDSTVRITYYPVIKKVSQSGFAFYTNKTAKHTFTQRITVHNSKATVPVSRLKIVDQVPMSDDEQIEVKLLTPALTLPNLHTVVVDGATHKAANVPASSSLAARIKVTDDVYALWDGADDGETDVDSLGKDGKFNWICSVPPQGKLALTAQWEVSVPVNLDVIGL